VAKKKKSSSLMWQRSTADIKRGIISSIGMRQRARRLHVTLASSKRHGMA